MKHLSIFLLIAAMPTIPSIATAQTVPTIRLPKCLEYGDSKVYVPCTGSVPVDTNTGNPLNWSDLFNSTGSSFKASGQPVVTYSFTSDGVSTSFIPLSHRGLHALIAPGIGSATCTLESFQDGSRWYPYRTVNGVLSIAINYTGSAVNEYISDDQANVPLRWNCSGVSGTVIVGFSQ